MSKKWIEVSIKPPSPSLEAQVVRKESRSWLFALFFAIFGLAFCLTVYSGVMRRINERNQRRLEACEANIQAISLAIVKAVRSERRMPASLQDLAPEYLETIPECDAAGRDTYSPSFPTEFQMMRSDRNHLVECEGDHHPKPREDSPIFRLVEHFLN